jgi:hypothetical protein
VTTDGTDVTDGKEVFFIREIREIRGYISEVAAGMPDEVLRLP